MRPLKPFPVHDTVPPRQGGRCIFGTVPEFCDWTPISVGPIQMSWRKEAFERLPEFRRFLREEKSTYNFLGELVTKLDAAYELKDDDLVKRIYGFVFWCMKAPRGKNASGDLLTAVACSFLEHLPQHDRIRNDIGRWFSRSDILGMSEIFHYHGTEDQYQEMLRASDTKNNRKAQPTAAAAASRRQ